MKLIRPAALAGALTLGACTAPEGLDVPGEIVADVAIAQIETWNAAGIDPVRAAPETLVLMAAACATAMALPALSRSLPSSETIAAFCEVALKAAAPAKV